MDINASVDIGNNTKELLQQLADKVGLTAEQVWPWYLKQQIIDAWVSIGWASFWVIISLANLLISRYFFKNDSENAGVLCIICFFVAFVLTIVVFGVNSPIDHLLNPEYHAMQALVADIAKIAGK